MFLMKLTPFSKGGSEKNSFFFSFLQISLISGFIDYSWILISGSAFIWL